MGKLIFAIILGLTLISCASNEISEKDKKDAIKLMEKGMLSYHVKKYNEAIGIFTKAIDLDSTNWEIFWKRGSAFNKLGKYDLAINDFNKCEILSDTIAPNIYVQRANSNQSLGKVKDAEKDFKRYVEFLPILPDGYTALGNFYIQNGQSDKGMKNIEKALEINPDYPEALLLMGAVLESKGQIDEACKFYNKALENGMIEAQEFINNTCH